MDAPEVFEHIATHFDEALPFVAYRKPNEKDLKVFLQEDDTLNTTTDYDESGFVFAPFDTAFAEAILIPDTTAITVSLSELSFENGEPHHTHSNPADQQRHIALVKNGISYIKKSGVKKIVLSRKQTINHAYEHPIAIFKRLLHAYPTAFAYCWYHPKVGLWLGATPETLLSISNRKFHTMALAGTQPYKDTLSVSWGTKEIQEQQFVTDAIVQNLKPILSDIKVTPAQTHRAGSLLHLKTDISAPFKSTETSLKTIIEALHPTPAVCGLPRSEAKDFILKNEVYERNYYTGFLGELNLQVTRKRSTHRRNMENLAYGSIQKESHLFVNLRCMEIDAKGAQIYVGGGITEQSNPEAEWQETVDKLSTMLRVLG
ncbi:isochorismate synthase [Dokdonia sinensis]|uniref:Isochorismate synthase n=1 Tax=Dokdonia sinensis TaxID=2479847 RepID=A0A3M0G553_9FLAO|nr:chorismate-binding protein [Dokdonia sinensis]RMB56973.1 isochorismate synthase [Dokdonia sinensis]